MGGDRRLAAVLWDMDGTLVDTEPYWIACEHELVAEFDGTWTSATTPTRSSGSTCSTRPSSCAIGAASGSSRVEIVEWLLDSVIAMASAELPWRPGAR